MTRGGTFHIRSINKAHPTRSEHLKRKSILPHPRRCIFITLAHFLVLKGHHKHQGSILCNEDKKNRAKSQNTFSSGKNLRSKYLEAWYKRRTDSSFTTSRQSLQDSSLLSSTEKWEAQFRIFPFLSPQCFVLASTADAWNF